MTELAVVTLLDEQLSELTRRLSKELAPMLAEPRPLEEAPGKEKTKVRAGYTLLLGGGGERASLGYGHVPGLLVEIVTFLSHACQAKRIGSNKEFKV